MRSLILFILILCRTLLSAQIYTVNSSEDSDDGICDGIHCTLREAIKASEADGVASTILFNIPGSGPHTIVPYGPFPDVTKDDLIIIGESQPGAPGSIVIDFNFRNLMGNSFFVIQGKRFQISGIDFTDYFYNDDADHLFQFGDSIHNAAGGKIYNCTFIGDNSFVPAPNQKSLITIQKADDICISKNLFGTDRTKSSIFNLSGYLQIEKTQGTGRVVIDSNVFVNREYMIRAFGGVLSISKNIFGALDTSKSANFLNPQYAISGEGVPQALIEDNFFVGTTQYAIGFSNSSGELRISKNRFQFCSNQVILVTDYKDGNIYILDNHARSGQVFLDAIANEDISLYVERNDVGVFDNFMLVTDSAGQDNKLIRYIDNWMTCIRREIVSITGAEPNPEISSVDTNQISGYGIPNDSVVIYFNERIGCPLANCQAGIELGRTKADSLGNWTLNASLSVNAAISAYQFNGDKSLSTNYYSQFSPCEYFITANEDSKVNDEIKIFPNPAKGKIKIEINESLPLSLIFTNMNGEKVNQLFIQSNSLEIDLGNYPTGLYYLQLINAGFNKITKIIVE